jgi:hypothetical protein
MQSILLALSFLFSALTSNARTSVENSASIDFKCVNSMPQTSFILRTDDKSNTDEVILTTIHHNGTQFMPIHEGVVVPNDFNYLNDVAGVLTLMGDRNEFRFDRRKCKIYGPGQMSCSSGSREIFQGREMQALFLNISHITEKAFGRTFENIKVTLSIYVSNFAPVQDLVMYYQPQECQLGF